MPDIGRGHPSRRRSASEPPRPRAHRLPPPEAGRRDADDRETHRDGKSATATRRRARPGVCSAAGEARDCAGAPEVLRDATLCKRTGRRAERRPAGLQRRRVPCSSPAVANSRRPLACCRGIGYAAGLLAYAGLREDKRPAPVSEESALPAIGRSLGGVTALVLSLTWLSTAGAYLLPPIILDQSRMSPIVVYPIWFTILLSAAAIAVLWWRCRRSVLDQWLMVVALVFMAELVFSGLLPAVRFSLGFYAGRVFSVMTSSIVLIVMLGETTRLYMRLAHSNAMLRREQDNKLMTMEAMAASISHEVRQPIAAISANSAAAIRLIQQEPPDLADAVSALKDVQVDTGRVNEILQYISALFGKGSQGRERIDINETAVAALRALRGRLVEHGVSVRSELRPDVPSIVGYRSQLQEVVINLLQNAVEAMDAVSDDRRVLTVRTKCDGDRAIVVEVEDTGPGIDAKSLNKVFDAFVTTKPGGMGLGLAICRTIIDRHGGRLSASPAHPRGTVFRIVLPQGAVPQ